MERDIERKILFTKAVLGLLSAVGTTAIAAGIYVGLTQDFSRRQGTSLQSQWPENRPGNDDYMNPGNPISPMNPANQYTSPSHPGGLFTPAPSNGK